MRKFALAAALLLGSLNVAHAAFVDGYLAECAAVGTSTCTELAVTGYARQLGNFQTAVGVTPLGWTVSGRGFDHLAGVLLLELRDRQ